MSSSYVFLVVSLLSSLRGFHVSSSNETCEDKPVFTPSRLVVKFGDPLSATCQVCKYACNRDSPLGLEIPIGKKEVNGTSVKWTVDKTNEWDMKPVCYYENDDGVQCRTTLTVTVYKLPVNTSITFENHNGPMLAGHNYTLQCAVQDVAPVENLTVTFYRGAMELGRRQSDDKEKKPVADEFTWTFKATEEDGEADYWCKAQLELGSEKPFMESERITTTVNYGPKVLTKPSVITVTQGRSLYLNCSARGNPPPSYTWMGPPESEASSYHGAVFTIDAVSFDHAGDYSCNVTNMVDTVTVTFRVEVKVDPIPFIITAVVVAVVLLLCGLFFGVCIYNRRYKMGQYNLKDVFLLRAQHVAVPLDG